MIVDLDAASGAAIEQEAKKAGVITVDYDRLTPGRRRGAVRLLRQRQGRRGAGHGPDPVPAGQGPEGGPVRRHRRRPDRQQRDAVRAGLRQRAVEDGRLDPRRQADRSVGRPDRRSRVQLDARRAPEHQGRHGRQRHDGRCCDHRPQAAGPERQGRGLRSGRHAPAACSTSWTATSASRSTSRPTLEADPAIKAIAQLVNGQAPDTNGVTITDPKTKKPGPGAPGHPDRRHQGERRPADQRPVHAEDHGLHGLHYAALCTKVGVK